MKVLVTGASGQVGGALLRTAPSGLRVLSPVHDELDLASAENVSDYLGREMPDLIVNAAAYTAVDKAEEEEDFARAINADAVAIMAASPARLVQISTDFVFDGMSPRAYGPEDTKNPLSAYGRTKSAGEDRLRPSDLLIRTSWVYEAGGANFVRTMLRLMAERNELRVVADQIGAPTWATGLAAVIWKLVQAEAVGIYHHSDAGVASWYDFAVAIAEEAQVLGMIERTPKILPVATADYPTRAVRPAFSLLDSQKTRALTGSTPVHWRSNLRLMLEQEKALG